VKRRRLSAEPRHIVRSRAIAQMLGHSVGWFYAHSDALEKAGFPKKTLLGGWSRAAIEQWLTRRAGLVAQSSDDRERERAWKAINARKARGALDRLRTPAQKKADREERRQAHAVRAAERARKSRGGDLP
jgi:predicted DNA-binding transcriptional regulator AlpA